MFLHCNSRNSAGIDCEIESSQHHCPLVEGNLAQYVSILPISTAASGQFFFTTLKIEPCLLHWPRTANEMPLQKLRTRRVCFLVGGGGGRKLWCSRQTRDPSVREFIGRNGTATDIEHHPLLYLHRGQQAYILTRHYMFPGLDWVKGVAWVGCRTAP